MHAVFHTKVFGDIERPKAAGPVCVLLEEIVRTKGPSVLLPTNVFGLVTPIRTKGRPPAPEPTGGLKVSSAPKGGYMNTGMVLHDKGHIMALELGGPELEIVVSYGDAVERARLSELAGRLPFKGL